MKESNKITHTGKVIALAGNPNVGKSTIFNALTGMNQHTGNWTGKTVSNAYGTHEYNGERFTIVDIPGTYSLISHSEEEKIAKDFLLSGEADAVIVVCDATALERNLNLVLQILNITDKVIVCINLLDEAFKKGIYVNLKKLSFLLGVPVVGTSAKRKKGLSELSKTLINLSERSDIIPVKTPENELIKKSEQIHNECVEYKNSNPISRDLKIDKILTNKLTGIPIMILLFCLIFWLTVSGANIPSALLSELLFGFEDFLIECAKNLKIPEIIYSPLILGVYRVVSWVVSVMLPPMAIFFPLFTFLEDLGYLPRIAFNLDKTFKKCSACGKQALTMCMGFGCNAVGVTGCRIIDSPRERLIAILTNCFVPCNGRFPTLIAIISMFFTFSLSGTVKSFFDAVILMSAILISVIMTFIVSNILSKTLLRGKTSSFTLELPPYRTPDIGKIIVRSVLDRTIFVLGRAVKASAPAGLIIWIFANVNIDGLSILSHCSSYLDPFANLLGLDGIILLAFILGIPANEIVIPIIMMAYLSSGNLTEFENIYVLRELLVENGWTLVTAINTLIFSLFHWPCATTIMTVHKETKSLKWTLISVILPTTCGMILCFIINSIFLFF